MEGLVVLFFSAIVSAVFAGYVADAKGYNMLGWMIIGGLFPLFGLIAAAGMPMKKGVTK